MQKTSICSDSHMQCLVDLISNICFVEINLRICSFSDHTQAIEYLDGDCSMVRGLGKFLRNTNEWDQSSLWKSICIWKSHTNYNIHDSTWNTAYRVSIVSAMKLSINSSWMMTILFGQDFYDQSDINQSGDELNYAVLLLCHITQWQNCTIHSAF